MNLSRRIRTHQSPVTNHSLLLSPTILTMIGAMLLMQQKWLMTLAGSLVKKMVAIQRPSSRRAMVKKAVTAKGASIRLACCAFTISQTCYRYESKLQPENEIIADWLIRLTQNQVNWDFGLCFLYLRNVKGFGWNHKRVYRIYRALELNLRIRPRK